MFCSISGTVPEEPVINKTSGYVYEKRLIEKVVQDIGKDPVTNEPLSLDELVPLKSNKAVKPRPSPATSIPGLLGLFHNEWDATMLEMHTLRSQLNTTRQELSHCLYQHDAACRVIARLVKERDTAREALASAQKALQGADERYTNGKRAAEDGVAEEPAKRAKGGITPDVIEAMVACSTALSKGRKKRAPPEGLASPEDIASYGLLHSYPLHKTTAAGIMAIDISPEAENIVATGGADCTVAVFDTAAGRTLGTLSGHSKRVNDVKFLGTQSLLASCSADRTTRIWSATEEGGAPYKCAHVLSDHQAEVVSITLHPTKEYFVTASADKTWAFYDIANAICLQQMEDSTLTGGYKCARFHPDGLIMGTGTTDSKVSIWDMRSLKSVASFEGHVGAVTSLSFSENGYYLATSSTSGVNLWDLRKLKNFKNLTPYPEGVVTNAVEFDQSGLYLGVGGQDARVYGVKQDWEVVKTFTDVPKKGVYSLKWGSLAKSMLVGSADHNLRIIGKPQE